MAFSKGELLYNSTNLFSCIQKYYIKQIVRERANIFPIGWLCVRHDVTADNFSSVQH